MAIDGKLYLEAQEAYRQWKLAARAACANNAGNPPLDCWKAYIARWEFLMSIALPISEAQQAQRLADWSALRFRPEALVGK